MTTPATKVLALPKDHPSPGSPLARAHFTDVIQVTSGAGTTTCRVRCRTTPMSPTPGTFSPAATHRALPKGQPSPGNQPSRGQAVAETHASCAPAPPLPGGHCMFESQYSRTAGTILPPTTDVASPTPMPSADHPFAAAEPWTSLITHSPQRSQISHFHSWSCAQTLLEVGTNFPAAQDPAAHREPPPPGAVPPRGQASSLHPYAMHHGAQTSSLHPSAVTHTRCQRGALSASRAASAARPRKPPPGWRTTDSPGSRWNRPPHDMRPGEHRQPGQALRVSQTTTARLAANEHPIER